MNLFAYGTLMCEDIMKSVAGFLPAKEGGEVQGFRRLEVVGEHYPGLVKSDGHRVAGVVYFDIPLESWSRLDSFEGDMYLRTEVEVLLSSGKKEKACIYVVKDEYISRLRSKDWSFEKFLDTGKGAFINHYNGYDEID